MKKIIKILIITFIIISIIGAIKIKIEGKNIMPYIISNASLNKTNNYGEIIIDYLTSNYLDDISNQKKDQLLKIAYLEEPPKIYIYNTHQKEEYETQTVLDASYYLKDCLKQLGINSIVEDRDIIGILNSKGLDYPYTYSITYDFTKEYIENNKDLKIFIDLHRDSVDKETSTVEINDNSYAKMMFLIGKENPNYLENEKHVKTMEAYLNNNYNGILRNTYYRNDTYNQQLSTYLFSVEIGSNYNTFEEVKNTLNAFSHALEYLLKENYD